MTNAIDARAAIAEWFETDFKESAKATTKTSRLEDGRLSYSFSVVNNSGFDFDKFSFKIKVIDRTNNVEIGTAAINAGKWASGEKKNFKSKLSIPAGVRNLSFVMYANSLDYLAMPADGVVPVVREASGTLKDIGDAITGADGSGGVFGGRDTDTQDRSARLGGCRRKACGRVLSSCAGRAGAFADDKGYHRSAYG
jgi:hypothetical protein